MSETLTMSEAEQVWSSDQGQWSQDVDLDPRVVLTRSAMEDARTFEAYRQGGAWTMSAEQETPVTSEPTATEHVLLEN